MSPEGAQGFLRPVAKTHAFGTPEMTVNFPTPSKVSDKTASRVLMHPLQGKALALTDTSEHFDSGFANGLKLMAPLRPKACCLMTV